jgi:hypothetical protein
LNKDIYELNLSKPLLEQVLALAGWQAGRAIDVSRLESAYQKYGYVLHDFARRVLAEFSGLPERWYFRLDAPNGRVCVGGNDYNFESSDILDFDDDEEDTAERLPQELRDRAIPVFNAGWHQFPYLVWACADGRLYRYVAIADKGLETFSSMAELLEADMRVLPLKYAAKAYVTFGKQWSLHWEKYIDGADGALKFGAGFSIASATTVSGFERSALFAEVAQTNEDDGCKRYALKPQYMDCDEYAITLYFRSDGGLDRAVLRCGEDYGDNGSEGRERWRKSEHDDALKRWLGAPSRKDTREYAWGNVVSSYDVSPNASQITIRYKR